MREGKLADIGPRRRSVHRRLRAAGETPSKAKSTLEAPGFVTASVSCETRRLEKIDTWVTKFLAWGGDTHIFRDVPATEQGGATEETPTVRRFLLSGVPGSQGVEHHGVNALGG